MAEGVADLLELNRKLEQRLANADKLYQQVYDENKRLRQALGYFLDSDPENVFAWKYKREEADAMAREVMGIGMIYGDWKVE